MLLIWMKIAICLIVVIGLLAESGNSLSQNRRTVPGEMVFRLVIAGFVLILIAQMGTEGFLAQLIM